ncbi:hypothetical protein [uncultured Bradyrhizobium sp.]|jgi:hypothetical protein|uniref:hypothetical protein n=1 Tax=uncultured Bradyrhizobium sp. TaxID=199684 RepID=UPI002618B0F2|nr:hypothetical protein [uncultured Bradyrhizobium sp.]
MPLKGRAFMAIWHDIEASGEAEYSDWHTRQHMPERLGVPGFLAGRRGVDWNLAHQRWFTLYETRTLEVLSSDDYRARLNNPTHWSNRVQPTFRNFARSACILSASAGRGMGGAMATIRLAMGKDALAGFEATADRLAHRIALLDGVCGAHLGVAAPQTTRIKTRESELRASTGEDVFDAVVLVDGVGRRELTRVVSDVQKLLHTALTVTSHEDGIYDLAYLLTAEDVE